MVQRLGCRIVVPQPELFFLKGLDKACRIVYIIVSNKETIMSNKEAKARYFKKIYDNAPETVCACGCGTVMKTKDKYGRDHKYLSGHNTPTKYEDPTQYKREWNHRNRPQRFQYKKERIHKLKSELIGIMGGQCKKCKFKYNGKNGASFDFHHIDPKTKKFALSYTGLNRYSRAQVDLELKKCILLCSNCHRLITADKF
jgi:hypothetical protein